MIRVYWDSMLWIYWLEKNPVFHSKVEHLWQTSLTQDHETSTSILTVGEVLGMPALMQSPQNTVKTFFTSGAVRILPMELKAMEFFAHIRAITRVPPADALHLACAAAYGVDYFLTNDTALHRLQIAGIQTIAGLNAKLA